MPRCHCQNPRCKRSGQLPILNNEHVLIRVVQHDQTICSGLFPVTRACLSSQERTDEFHQIRQLVLNGNGQIDSSRPFGNLGARRVVVLRLDGDIGRTVLVVLDIVAVFIVYSKRR